MAEDKKPFHERVAEKLIEQLQKGAAPWQIPWESSGPLLPYNPITDKRYKGINLIHLFMQGYDDARWMTYKQAQAEGWQVKKGEKSTSIQYWKLSETRDLKDSAGKPVLDKDGQTVKLEVKLERPRAFFASVFNARQIDGLPQIVEVKHDWNAQERAEAILANSGAVIQHDARSAFYRPSTDTIHLPAKSQFKSADGYYATALHELGHWSGHETRLKRDLSHPFGSEGYAKEELRAEIFSLILGQELGIGHDPGQHAAYVGSWIKIIKEDALEIFRAAADAEKMQAYVMNLEHVQRQEIILEKGEHPMESDTAETLTTTTVSNIADRPIYLTVPFAEKDAAFKIGARWDRDNKLWFIPPGLDVALFSKWHIKADPAIAVDSTASIRQEFADSLRSLSLVVEEPHPIMDGKTHRIKDVSDKGPQSAGFYVVHMDGHPAGYIKNNRTQEEINWKSKGYALDADNKAQLLVVATQKKLDRELERKKTEEKVEKEIAELFTRLRPVEQQTAYLKTKDIPVMAGIYTDAAGQITCVPVHDASGKVHSVQTIDGSGQKRFLQGGRKESYFHAVGGMAALEKAPAIVIAEGYSTAATIASALGYATVAAFDNGNLPPVAVALRDKFPDKPFLIACDNDVHLQTRGINPGVEKGTEAAKLVQAGIVLPVFSPDEQAKASKDYKDFNDLAVKSAIGKEGAKKQLQLAVTQIIAKHQEERVQRKTLQKSVGLKHQA